MTGSATFRYLSVLLVILLSSCVSSNRTGFNPGDLAPPITLTDLDGKVRTLEEFRGKVVLLNFWATWCLPCMMEMPSIQNLYTMFNKDGFEIIAIGVDDTKEAMLKLRQQQNLTFAMLFDDKNVAKSSYKITGVPESFVIGRDGRLLMVIDPDDDQPAVRLIGPKKWDSPAFVSRLREIVTSRR